MYRPGVVVPLVLFLILSGLRGQETPRRDAKRGSLPRTLPGIQRDGAILLPNQWSLRPAGKQIELGDFPVTLALHPGGHWLAALHAGYGEHEIIIVDLKRQRIVSRVALDQTFYGLCFSPDGRRLFVSGGEFEVVHAFDFEDGFLSRHREIPIVSVKEKFIPAGITTDQAGTALIVAGPWGDRVCIASLDSSEKRFISFEKESYPYACLAGHGGKAIYVSLWNKSAVARIESGSQASALRWETESHPTEMALSPSGDTLYVACANSTKVSVLDTSNGEKLQTIGCALYPKVPAGNTPSSLALSPDGSMLFVANADANNVAVFNVADRRRAKPLGFIPVGWYPTSVRYNASDGRLYVANGKGTTPKANPQGPSPTFPVTKLDPDPVYPLNKTVRQYIAGLFRGTLEIIDRPTPEKMASYTKEAYSCSPLRPDLRVAAKAPADNPIPKKVGDPSPIKHVIYIIKENRTYDQVLGDMKEGNGDASLCLFPESVTPNHHGIAREFVLLDNFYVDGEVSADGHEWTMGAYATDFVKRTWPINYRPGNKEKIPYPSEGTVDAIARPAGGYLWDRCAEAGISYRSYGEWIATGKTVKDPGKALTKTLEGHFDQWFRGWDLDYPDQKRADRFIEELGRFEREGDMPRFIVLRLPNDHTSGTVAGKPTPTAYLADNDLALGRVIEAVTKSKFWKGTAIFVIEDDAQDGPDHVDAHRTVAFVVSPYAKRGVVDSSMYSTTSMVRTMELILGLKPMSQFDAAARPMYHAFAGAPDLRPYQHAVPRADLEEKNQPTAWGARLSEKFDLAKEDQADDHVLNEVIWRSVRGAHSPMPAPVRAAFFFPHPAKPRDKDD
jgi:DNA-binding beta-propeller fold protein YncE